MLIENTYINVEKYINAILKKKFIARRIYE